MCKPEMSRRGIKIFGGHMCQIEPLPADLSRILSSEQQKLGAVCPLASLGDVTVDSLGATSSCGWLCLMFCLCPNLFVDLAIAMSS